MPEQSTLDARLAEIDRRLRLIQSGLAPPAAPPMPPASTLKEPRRPLVGERPGGAPGSAGSPSSDRPPRSVGGPGSLGSDGAPSAAGAPSATSAPRGELAEVGRLIGELRELTAAHERLLASSRELLSAFADAVARPQPGGFAGSSYGAIPSPVPPAGMPHPGQSGYAPPPSYGFTPPPPAYGYDAPSAGAPPLGMTAGPFTDTGALRRFEHSLSMLPEVRDVAVREYAEGGRVILDVHLHRPIS